MSADAVYLDFEDPGPARAEARKKRLEGRPRKKREPIPVLPAMSIPIEEIRGHPGRRARACVNLRIERVPWHEVVRLLEYSTLAEARADFLRAIAGMHQEEDAETMRLLTIANAEQMLQRSMAMAAADFLIDADVPDKKIANRDKLRWHQQANADLNLLATITGVKSPIKVEVTPTEEQYAVLTAAILHSRGVEPVLEAEVLELEELPAEPDELP